MFDRFKDFIGIDDNYDDYDEDQLYYEDDDKDHSSSRQSYSHLLDNDDLSSDTDDSLTYESGYSSTDSDYTGAFASSNNSYNSDSYTSNSSKSFLRSSKRGDNVVSMTDSKFSNKSQMRISIQEPLDYDKDALNVIDDIHDNKVVVLNLEMVDSDLRQRIFDFVSGAVYALEGTVQKVTKGIFVISPKGVEVDSSVTEQISDGNYNQL